MADQNDTTPAKKKNDKTFFIVAILLFLGLAAVYAFSLGPMATPANEEVVAEADLDVIDETVAETDELDEGVDGVLTDFTFDLNEAKRERILGDTSAPIKITEHSSFSCGHCGKFHKETFDAFKTNYIDTGKAYLVFSDFPLNGPALHATMIGRCVSDDKYFEYVEELFKDQDNWAFQPNYLSILEEKAGKYGLDKAAVETCLQNQELQDAILKRMQAVQQQYGVNSTPSFVVNNQTVVNGALPYADFDAAIQAALAEINSPEEASEAQEPAEEAEEEAPAEVTPEESE